MCDHQAPLSERRHSWPGLLARSTRRTDDWVKMSEYFDAVNFARRIKAPILVSAGFIDTTCPPTNVYAAFNVIKAPKGIFGLTDQPHSWFITPVARRWWDFQNRWTQGQLGLGPQVPLPARMH